MRRAGYFFALLPLLAVLAMILVCGVDIPHWDEWVTPGQMFVAMARGDLALSDFTAAHNESRPAFPRLITAALAPIAGWHPKMHMLVGWLAALLTTILLPRLQSESGRTPQWLLCVWPVMSALLATPAQWQSHLMGGVLLVVYFPPLCLVLALMLQRSRAPDGQVFAGCSLLNLLATYSYSNGFILWVLAFPWLRARRVARRWIAFYLLAGAIAVVLFFGGNVSARNRARTEWDAARVQNAGRYFLSWTAMPYVQRADWRPWATLAGAVLVAAAAGVLLRTRRDLRQGLVLDQDIFPWLMLTGYAILSGALAAHGRIQHGVEQALQSRYASFACWFSVGILGLAAWSGSRFVRRAALVAAVMCACVSWTGSAPDIREWRHKMLQSRLTARLVDFMPRNPMLAALNPEVDRTVQTIELLLPAGLMPFNAPGKKVAAALARPERKPAGFFKVQPVSSNLFVLEGWAGVPGSDRPADFVVFLAGDADGKARPFTASIIDRPRRDVVQEFGKPSLLRSGFRLVVPAPQPDASRLSAFAVDETTWRAHPLRRVE